MQILGIPEPGSDLSPSRLGVVQVPPRFPLPSAVAPRSAHPLSPLAVHRSSTPVSASAILTLNIYELSWPRPNSERASRPGSAIKILCHNSSAPFPQPFSTTKSGIDNVAKVDIDTTTKELAELALQLEEILRQEYPLDNLTQRYPRSCRCRRTGSAGLPAAAAAHPPIVYPNASTLTTDDLVTSVPTAYPNGAQGQPATPQAELATLDKPFGRLSINANLSNIPEASQESPRLDHPFSAMGEALLSSSGLGSSSKGQGVHQANEDVTGANDQGSPSPQVLSHGVPWLLDPSPRRSRHGLDSEARFSMVMEVLSSKPVEVRRTAFDVDLWSFTSAGNALYEEQLVYQIFREASIGMEPRRLWLFRELFLRALSPDERRRWLRRDHAHMARREVRSEPAGGPAVVEEESERDTEEEAAKAIDSAEAAAKESESFVEDEQEGTSEAADSDSTPRASVDVSTNSSHSKRPSISEATIRPSTPSSDHSSDIAPAYTPEWIPIGQDRLGYSWWFVVDYNCDLYWSFSYLDENNNPVFLPERDYERVQSMRRRIAAMQRGSLSVAVEEES